MNKNLMKMDEMFRTKIAKLEQMLIDEDIIPEPDDDDKFYEQKPFF